uniref:Reverse transcriptase Ty1/copia-type domain-containing protein n=1 Tax=Chromera velia CCMP2878 TaxID=1169474 RepID=A0A0G4HAP1_9ALVE|eukprot:Cvel_25770.t1-p1 / transcript=Cvel_25770.t1 / gene=Cvel_25770 / organism=Chromera_velia_CCMP2878 / gene_product=Copia protein, putative / transcript_product=Copia protein, putative / location=Cvel_scaffold2968:18425-20410(+) / protein_length=525 / sequence_SO=supercontig / SO=protein_coding / is_pseudo=false
MRSIRRVPTSDVLCPAGSGHRATIPRERDQKKDQGWIDQEVYIRTPISEVLRNVPRVLRTEKLQDDGTRKFKARTIINGKQVPREGLSVATRLCPPKAVRIILQIASDACKRRGVDLSLQKADVVQAYLEAPLPLDRLPLAVISPSDHPDYGQFLWVLRKAVYGLPDAGKVFEDFLTSVLRSFGWKPTLFPGMWVLRRADGELRALLATYYDDLLILGISEDAAATIDPLKDIVIYGDYTDLSEGHFIGVQFNVSTTGVFCHQHNYVVSLVLPPDMAGSNRRADKPLPVGSTHEDGTSPLLSAAGVKVFRTLLGQVGYVASCTRLDIALMHSIYIRPSSDPTKLTAIEYGDSSFGNAASPHPQTGWVVFINNSPLIWKSRRQSRVARSTTRAEVLALEEGIDAALHFANCTAPFYSNIRVRIGCDAANVLSLLLSGASSSAERALLPIIQEMQDKACIVPLQAATDLVEQHRIGIFKIPTESNLSDLLTKALDLGALTHLMSPSPSCLGARLCLLFLLLRCVTAR